MTFTAGQTITVNDRNNFYFGRKATVKYVNNDYGTLYVMVASASGNATIGFNLKQKDAEAA